MRIKKLELKNFRGFEELTIDFPEGESGLAVFVGVNGSGKTSILEAIAFLLQSFVFDVFGVTSKNPIQISHADIHVNAEQASLTIDKADMHIGEFSRSTRWTYQINFVGIVKSKHTEHLGESIQRMLSRNDLINLPILAYYGTNRVLEEESSIQERFVSPQAETYSDAFRKKLNFSTFIHWFIEQTNIENNLKIEKQDFDITNPKLDTVRRAMMRFLEYFPSSSFSDIRVGVSKLTSKLSTKQTLLVSKDNQPFAISQLSEGERMMLMVIFDISYRLAVANPSLEDSLSGSGIVLIDELDLHLHPSWQRKVVEALHRTFPNIQFILTTHSPQVLSNVPTENVFVLKDFKLRIFPPYHTYGKDSNAILNEVFEIGESRPEHGVLDLKELYSYIDKNDRKNAEKKLEELRGKFGASDTDLVRAEMYIELLDE
jgi:predicted ATP-binding protein involved in virulence